MYESTRKSYINMLSRKLLKSETWLWRQKLFSLKKTNWIFFHLHHRMYESSRESYIIKLSRKIMTFETWYWRRKMFTIKKTTEMFFFSKSKHGWIIQKNLLHPAISQTVDFWELFMEQKLFRIKKQFLKKLTFIIGCLSHSEKAASSCYLANYWLLRIEKNDLHHRMYEIFRKSHIIMLSPKLSTFDSWLCSKSCLKSKNN